MAKATPKVRRQRVARKSPQNLFRLLAQAEKSGDNSNLYYIWSALSAAAAVENCETVFGPLLRAADRALWAMILAPAQYGQDISNKLEMYKVTIENGSDWRDHRDHFLLESTAADLRHTWGELKGVA